MAETQTKRFSFWHRREPGDPRPFRHAGDPADPFNPAGVLLIHGFSGTPFELHLLGADLHRRGYPCEAPLLAGHDAGVAGLGATGWRDWLGSAEAALLDLHRRLSEIGAATGKTPRLCVVGLSMGGLLTLELARRHAPLIDAIATLAVPLWLPPASMRGIRRLQASRWFSGMSLPKLLGSDVKDKAMRWVNPATGGLPVAALGSLLDLMEHVRAGLPEVNRPALLAHAVHDHTAPYACLEALRLGLGTPPEQITVLSLPQSYHLITLDVERDLLFEAVAAHLGRYLRP